MTSVQPLGTDFVSVRNRERALQSQPDREINALEEIIGRVPDHIRHDYVNEQSVAYNDLTDLLMKRAPPVVKTYVTGLLTEGYVSPYTAFLMPIRQMRDDEGLVAKWTEINFTPGLAPQVEVEGVAPIWTHNETERTEYIRRRAAGAKIEMGFWNTEKGRQQWVMKLNHMASIILRTNEYLIMMTLLQAPMDQHVHANEMNGPYNVYGSKTNLSFEERLKMEIDMFGLVNKTPQSKGFINLCSTIRTNMLMNGVRPDAMIVPPYMLSYFYSTKSDLWAYDQAGPNMNENHRRAQEINATSAFKSYKIQDMAVIETSIYRPTKGGNGDHETIDLLSLETQIGEFYPVEIDNVYTDLQDFKRYKSRSRNIRIFNERHGRFAVIKLRDMIQNCLRWNAAGGLHDDHDNNYPGFQDMFAFQADQEETWGNVDEKYIPQQHHARVIQTFMNRFSDDERKELDNLIMKYKELLGNPDTVRNEAGVPIERGAGAVFDNTVNRIKDKIKDTLITRVLNLYNYCTSSEAVFNDFDEFINEVSSSNPDYGKVHFNVLHQGLSPLSRMFLMLWFNQKINLKSLLAMCDNDIYVPVNFLLTRQYMTYVTSSCIFMKAGTETGETLIGRQDFRIAPNDVDRTLYCSMAYYTGQLLKRPRNVAVAPNIFIQSYVKGNDTSFIKDRDLEEIREFGGLKHSANSILCFMIPPTSRVMDHNIIDIRGRCEDLNNNEEFFPCSAFYENRLSIDPLDVESVSDPYFDYDSMGYKCKTLACLGHFEYGEDFSQVQTNTGHLGPYTYEQVNLTRTPAQYTPIQQVQYNVKVLN